MFRNPLYVGRPNIGNREKLLERVSGIVERRWLTNDGPVVQEFERKVAERVGVKHCVAVCNGTVGLELAIRATGLEGEVVLPSFTFVATAHALQWQRVTPVFCDVDPATHNLDVRSVEERITPRTTGIIGVHLWGRACAIEELSALAEQHRLVLLFDAAHAFGASYRGRMIGSFGAAEVFSFHATKVVNAGEGGAVVTDNDDLARRLRLMRNFGFTGYDAVTAVGTNGKMSEFSAALGLTNLESMDEFVVANRRNHAAYDKELATLPGVTLTRYEEQEKNNYQYVIVEWDEAIAGISRDDLMAILWAENILARRYFFPGCHRMEPYWSLDPHAAERLSETERLANRVLALPTGTAVGLEDIAGICAVLRNILRNRSVISRRLKERPSKP